MSFVSKFKPVTHNTSEAPPGVDYAHTSFGYQKNQQPYSGLVPPKNSIQQKPRPRGGWDDDDDEEPQLRGATQGLYETNETQARSAEVKQITEAKETSNKSMKEFEIFQSDQSFIANHEYEYKLIDSLIQPGGARLKQPEQLLNNFCRACESLQVSVIGSLILNQLNNDIPFVSRARLLYLLEALVRKLDKYSDYLQYNLNYFQSIDFSQEGSNTPQLIKIREDIVKFISGTENTKKISIPYTKPSESMKENHLKENEDLLGLIQTETHPSNNSQNQSSNPKKIDPFNLHPSNSNQQQNLTKPSSGPSFAKFKAHASNDKTQSVPQSNNSNQSNNNLIDALSGLDFGSVQPNPVQTSVSSQGNGKSQNENTVHHTQQTFNSVPGGFASQQYNSFGGSGYYGGNANVYGGFNKQPYGNAGFTPPPNNYQGGGFGFSGGVTEFKQSSGAAYSQNVQFEKATSNGNRFDELYNLVHQDFHLEEEDKKKKMKAQNEKAFDALKF